MSSELTSLTNATLCQPTLTTGKVDGFSRYTICRNGNVVNDKTKTLLRGSAQSSGYRQYYLRNDDGELHKMYGHRLVAIAFIPNPEQRTEVDHVDRVRTNNHISNLRWSTRSENLINKGMPTRKNKGDGFRHIRKARVRKYEYYRIEIRRNNKNIVDKHYRTEKYTLQQVVKIRNEFYKQHDIKIQDE